MTESGRSVELYLIRHADAGDPDAWEGDDAVRPLSKKGIRQSERLGRHLAAVGFAPDVILTSPKARALQTAEIVGKALGIEPRIDERLAASVDVDDLEPILRDAGSPRRPVLVGHDPDFSELLGALIGARLTMKKGALARVDMGSGMRDGDRQLRWLLSPDLLPRDE